MKLFSCNNLSFSFGKKIIFDNINFEINKGDIIALVGNNGSGKTTLLKIIIGYIKTKLNINLKISFLINSPAFYPYLTGYQNLEYFAIIENIPKPRIIEVLKIVNLTNVKDIKFFNYSLGMKQKLAIAKCLLKESDLYLFDEPLNGLDPSSIILFNKIINDLKKEGKTIIISSHILKELNEVCNKIFFINNYKLNTYINENTNNYLIKVNYIPTFIKDNIIDNNSFNFKGDINSLNNLIINLVTHQVLIKEIILNNNFIESLFRGNHEIS